MGRHNRPSETARLQTALISIYYIDFKRKGLKPVDALNSSAIKYGKQAFEMERPSERLPFATFLCLSQKQIS
jgi:hypothetical protein